MWRGGERRGRAGLGWTGLGWDGAGMGWDGMGWYGWGGVGRLVITHFLAERIDRVACVCMCMCVCVYFSRKEKVMMQCTGGRKVTINQEITSYKELFFIRCLVSSFTNSLPST